jgi:putative transcriptional regulator
MKTEHFADLLASATEALEHARGKRELRTTVLPAPPAPMSAHDVRELRARVNVSQGVFARVMNVSTKLVQAWESGQRTPTAAALKLLRIGQQHPEVLFGTLAPRQLAVAERSADRRAVAPPRRPRTPNP